LTLDIGAQGLIILSKYACTYSHYDVTDKKQIFKTFQFFFLNWNYKTFCICWVFEQLSCSIGWRVMAFSQYGQGYLLFDLIFHQNLGFRAIILDPERLKSRSWVLMTWIMA